MALSRQKNKVLQYFIFYKMNSNNIKNLLKIKLVSYRYIGYFITMYLMY